MKSKVLSNIRMTRIKDFIFIFILGILPNLGIFIFVAEGNLDETWLGLAITAILAWYADFCLVKTLIMIIHPDRNSVFRKYGGVEKLEAIVEEINNTKEYEDNKMVLSKNYIASKRCYEDIISYDNILLVYKLVHKTNYVIDRYAVVIIDKYNEKVQYDYFRGQEELVDKLILIIGYKSKNAKLGYSPQAIQYVKDNIVSIPAEKTFEQKKQESKSDVAKQNPQINVEIPKIEKYMCPDCNEFITMDDKFCRNCGCKIDWT